MSPSAKRRRRSGALARAAPVFAALGNETRLELVLRLCAEGPLSIARLTEGTDVTRQAVTKHVRVLADAGLVRGSGAGRDRAFEVEPARLEDARVWLARIEEQWDEALQRLKGALEGS
jgi:DNA-binding transcriptional ArsR family regulator